ncbi:hypothetical protein [Litoribacillus peritrichatus]|uniref:Glycine zipper family protein n=1 Tax=Litoribacillus peritrichatus TaxID=718191 RepID=A0ABP7MRU7_9GAMM
MSVGIKTRDDVKSALQQLEVQALYFSHESIKNSQARMWYLREIKLMSADTLKAYERGLMSANEAAVLANGMRNDILNKSRSMQTKMGLKYSESLKKQGKVLADLLDQYSIERYKKPFNSLTSELDKEAVFVDVIKAAGRDRGAATRVAYRLKWSARICWVLTAGVAFYNIFTSENKTWATGREVTTLGVGVGGSFAGGAVAGIWLGPIGMAIGAAIGGVFGAVVGNEAYLEFTGPERQASANIVAPNTKMFYTDEKRIASDLVKKSGIVMDEVYKVFLELDSNYNSDADDVALLYVNTIKQQRGSIEQGLRIHKPLNNLLIRILEDGWTSNKEKQTINYLRSLQTS